MMNEWTARWEVGGARWGLPASTRGGKMSVWVAGWLGGWMAGWLGGRTAYPLREDGGGSRALAWPMVDDWQSVTIDAATTDAAEIAS